MQEERSLPDIQTRASVDWEFKLDGTFVEKWMPDIWERAPGVAWDDALKSAGWGYPVELCRGTPSFEVKIWYKERTAEFLVDISGMDHFLGLILCRNLATLMEFFRRYESFLSLGRNRELDQAISNVNRYLFDDCDGLEIVKRIEAKERAEDARYKQSRKA